jgi:hypothetical protein
MNTQFKIHFESILTYTTRVVLVIMCLVHKCTTKWIYIKFSTTPHKSCMVNAFHTFLTKNICFMLCFNMNLLTDIGCNTPIAVTTY